ncbi:MAG: carbonic anhydrase family protein [Rhodoplanes sp.]
MRFAASAAGQEFYNYADPRNWGGECQTGAQQSPVDLTTSNGVYDAPYDAASNTPFLRYWYYPPFPLTLKNTGTTMVAPPNGGKIALNGRAYQLDQIHWHHPAEHGFFDLNPDLEVHLVHKDERGNLLVLALFLAARGGDDHHRWSRHPKDGVDPSGRRGPVRGCDVRCAIADRGRTDDLHLLHRIQNNPAM